jgi:hypothetical protein
VCATKLAQVSSRVFKSIVGQSNKTGESKMGWKIVFLSGIFLTIIFSQTLLGYHNIDPGKIKVQLIALEGELTFDDDEKKVEFIGSAKEFPDDKKSELIRLLRKRFKDIYESIKKGNEDWGTIKKSGNPNEDLKKFLAAYEYSKWVKARVTE